MEPKLRQTTSVPVTLPFLHYRIATKCRITPLFYPHLESCHAMLCAPKPASMLNLRGEARSRDGTHFPIDSLLPPFVAKKLPPLPPGPPPGGAAPEGKFDAAGAEHHTSMGGGPELPHAALQVNSRQRNNTDSSTASSSTAETISSEADASSTILTINKPSFETE